MNNAELNAKLDTLLDGITTAAAALTDVSTQLTKATSEINKEIADLKALIAAGGVTTPEIDAKLETISSGVATLASLAPAIKSASQTLDDLNPDAV